MGDWLFDSCFHSSKHKPFTMALANFPPGNQSPNSTLPLMCHSCNILPLELTESSGRLQMVCLHCNASPGLVGFEFADSGFASLGFECPHYILTLGLEFLDQGHKPTAPASTLKYADPSQTTIFPGFLLTSPGVAALVPGLWFSVGIFYYPLHMLQEVVAASPVPNRSGQATFLGLQAPSNWSQQQVEVTI